MEYNYKQFKRPISSRNVAFKVKDHVIKCEGETLQITNIASMSLSYRVLAVKEPKPTFNLNNFKKNNPKPSPNQKEPGFELNLIITITATVIAFIFTKLFNKNTFGVLLPTMGTGFVFFLISIIKYNYDKNQWSSEAEYQAIAWNENKDKEKAEVRRKQKIWNGMRKNPPILYSLMFEMSSGDRKQFYSFNKQQIIQTKDAIERSMEKRGDSNITFNIDTINVGSEDSINNFGSEIYNQTINN